MPIIEGQKTGRIVVTSKIEPLMEVAGDSVAYVDPFDSRAIRLGFLKVIKDDDYRMKKIALGITNVERFDVKKIAKEYVEIYQELTAN